MPKSTSTDTSFADLVPKGYRVTLGRGETAESEAERNLNLLLYSEAKTIDHIACKSDLKRALTAKERDQVERCRKNVV
jgi:hypothetical protein